MIGLDTNVLVRYFAQDDPDQATQATALIDALTQSRPGYVTTIVLAETYWVLCRAYRVDRETAIAILRGLTSASEIVVQHADVVRRALRQATDGADLADSLIAQLSAEAGCERTVTFDRRAAKLAGMQLLA